MILLPESVMETFSLLEFTYMRGSADNSSRTANLFTARYVLFRIISTLKFVYSAWLLFLGNTLIEVEDWFEAVTLCEKKLPYNNTIPAATHIKNSSTKATKRVFIQSTIHFM